MMTDAIPSDWRRMALLRTGSLVVVLLLAAARGQPSTSDDIPRFTVQPSSVVQKMGGRVTLLCSVEPLTANVSWHLNGQELGEGNASLGVLVQPDSLVIPSLSNLTVGRYQCIATTVAGARASVPANVTAAKLRDFEPDDQQDIEVDEGNTAVIECHLPESQPKAQVRYSVKQEWLETSKGNYLIMPSGNLQIVNATQEDEGTYKCAAYNPVTQEVKTSSSTDRLRIRRASAEAARIIYPPGSRSIIVTKGQRLVLECVASGIPPPQVTWAKDGADLRPHNKTRFLLSNLLIDATSEADSGTYVCQADNGMGPLGTASIVYSVQVLEPPEVSVELQPPPQQLVPWGETVRFSCSARGNPPPSVVWLHNARPLAPTPRHRLSARLLRVLSVGPQDEGIYQCMAENGVGSSQAAARLITVPNGTASKAGKQLPVDFLPLPDVLRPLSPDKILIDRTSQKPGAAGPAGPPDCSGLSGQVSPAEAPVILSLPRTGKADSYELLWKPRHDGGAPVLEYVVKYRKAGDSSDDWTMLTVPGTLHKLALTRLDPASLYEVEMAARNCAGLGQAAMMTFRTGKGRSNAQKVQVPGLSGQEEFQKDFAKGKVLMEARLSPPEAPDRPTISMASETSAYVTWIPRGNRGFPIQSFRVEHKKLKKGGDWVVAVANIPPSRLSVEITGLEKGTSYKFRVRAVNVLGESPPSAPSKAYTVSGSGHRPYERPVAGPYITYNEAINETTIMLKWTYTPTNNNTPIYGFYIFYRPTDSDNDSDYKKDVVEGDRYWHSITDLQPETAYDIKMQCFNEGGESEFGNVVILETKARKHSRPPPVEATSHSTETGGAVATVPRSSDLPYLIVGVVLGALVFIIVAFIPFCLWRAWAKQKQTTDLCFPAVAAPVSSCQYTMVPLQGVVLTPGHCTADAALLPQFSSSHLPLPLGDYTANGKVPGYCLSDLHQGGVECAMECSALLPQAPNGRPAACLYSERVPEADPDDQCCLADGSACPGLRTPAGPPGLCQVTGGDSHCGAKGTGGERPISAGLPCSAVLTPVEEAETPEPLQCQSCCGASRPWSQHALEQEVADTGHGETDLGERGAQNSLDE
ncbi:brother of CDO [Lepisosteus oculatus]|uniref:brother of CDO n=1 Tax=Lepisosteus oculatus TaxID=7918 RepID=UPI003717788B